MLNMVDIRDIESNLNKLGAYLATKIRHDSNAALEVELYCSLNRIRDCFRTMKSVMQENGLLDHE